MPDTEIFFEEKHALELAKAIERGDIDDINQIAPRLDINQPHIRGMTFLNWAFANLQYESAAALIALKADPHVETESHSPLSQALEYEDDRWITLLIENGADINAKSNNSPIWYDLILRENWQRLDYLLNKGLNLNATNSIGESAIFRLAAYMHYGQVVKLIEQGADIHLVTKADLSFARRVQDREVASDHPEFKNREKVIKLLEKAGYQFPVPGPEEIRAQRASNQ